MPTLLSIGKISFLYSVFVVLEAKAPPPDPVIEELVCLFLELHSLVTYFVSQDEIEVKKDTERQDEIKAMKQAWEAAEPGRAAKVEEG